MGIAKLSCMKILLATSNPHKLGEIRAILAEQADGLPSMGFDIVSLSDVGLDIDEPVEDQPTFEGNAELKARYYADHAGMPCIADDSGLEVDALGGEPGVISARYAGAEGPRDVVDPANNRKLLDELGDTPMDKRTARFVCVMCFFDPAAEQSVLVRGDVAGRILLPDETADPACPERGRGTNGFGYDPLFFIPSLGKTSAELSPDHKNRISHRGDATRKLFAALRAQ